MQGYIGFWCSYFQNYSGSHSQTECSNSANDFIGLEVVA